MRLYELTARSKLDITPGEAANAMLDYIPQPEDDSPWDGFVKLLHARGFEPFEPGAFGVAFAHPGLPYVIKVFDTYKDKGYLGFLRYCQGHRDNPHLPRFRGKFTRVDGEEDLYWCRMERLDPLMEETQRVLKTVVDTIRDGALTIEQAKAMHGSPNDLDEWGITDSFIQTLLDLSKECRDRGFYYDLHGNNVMERSDLTLVVIDPFDSAG